MSLEQVLQELESMKDWVNSNAEKVTHVESIKRMVRELVAEKDWVAQEPVIPQVTDRRNEERDPGEHEQHEAEDLGFTPKRKAVK